MTYGRISGRIVGLDYNGRQSRHNGRGGMLNSPGAGLLTADGIIELTHTVIPNRGSLTPSFTRATTETGQKYDSAGYFDFTALAGEVIFKGAMRIYNEWTTSSVSLASGANKSLTLAAGTYQFSMGIGTGTATFSGTGGATGTLDASLFARVGVAKTITAGTLVITASVADLADLQVCNSTGETDQTTLRPYVSVGALVRNTQDPLYYSTPGTAEHYAGSPAKTLSTGDMALAGKFAATDWTPAALQMLVAKDTSAGNRDWGLYQDSAGIKALVFYWWESGGAVKIITSTVAPSTLDGGVLYVAVTLDVDNGAAGNDVKFWTSTNGTTWTQLGATVTTAGVTNVRDTAATYYLGNYGIGGPFAGSIHSVQMYAGIPTFLSGAGGETLKFDFNPHRDATTPTGTITSSTTGEVWTLNGASSVIRNVSYHGSCVDGVKCFPTDLSGNPIPRTGSYPLVGYVPWEARTNHFLNSGTPATQTSASLGTGTYTLWMTGTGSIAVAGTTATITGAGTAIAGTPVTFVVTVAGTVTYTVSGSPTKAQAENGAFATPYIITAGAAVARDADILTYTGASGYKAMACTFSRGVGVTSVGESVALSDGTANNYVEHAFLSGTAHVIQGGVGGATQFSMSPAAYVAGATGKVSCSFAANDIKGDYNGTAQTPDTSAAVPAITQISVGHVAGSFVFNGPVTDLYFWTRNLSQSELGAVDR